MNIYLTLDYELYFGTPSGSVDRCILNPTDRLLEITEKTGAVMTYFVDAGYLLKLKQYSHEYPALKRDYDLVVDQIRRMVDQGNECALHIHPHWEDAVYDGSAWQMDVSRYKLADFNDNAVKDIFKKYKTILEEVTGRPVYSYRAGGWCLQPFERFEAVFRDNNIKLDSTVFSGGYKHNDTYFYDFRSTPNKTRWYFTSSLTEEDTSGQFLELPISSYTYGPLFFWSLFGMGRLNPSNHKPIGDGKPVPGGGSKKELLFKRNVLPVSLDGYFVTRLNRALRHVKGNDMVVIGHPKACTPFSLDRLEQFILKHNKTHQFQTLGSQI